MEGVGAPGRGARPPPRQDPRGRHGHMSRRAVRPTRAEGRPTHPLSRGAVRACVSLDAGTNGGVSLGGDRPEPGGQGWTRGSPRLQPRLSLRGVPALPALPEGTRAHLAGSGPRSPRPSLGPGPRPSRGGRRGNAHLISGGPCAPLPAGLPVSSRLPLERPEGSATPSPSWAGTPCRSPSPRLYATPGCTPTGSAVPTCPGARQVTRSRDPAFGSVPRTARR